MPIEKNCRPAPVSTTAWTSSSPARPWTIFSRPSSTSRVWRLSSHGRSSVTTAPRPSRWHVTSLATSALDLAGFDVHAGRALSVAHVLAHRLGRGDGVALSVPLRALGHPRVLELVEREVGGPPLDGPIAATADHTGDLLVVRHVDRVVPLVPFG